MKIDQNDLDLLCGKVVGSAVSLNKARLLQR